MLALSEGVHHVYLSPRRTSWMETAEIGSAYHRENCGGVQV
jgi:hypothetical protein